MFFEHADICSGPRTPFGSRSISCVLFFAPLKNAPNRFNTKGVTRRAMARSVPHYSTTISLLERYTDRYIVKLNRIGTINVAKTAKQSLIVRFRHDLKAAGLEFEQTLGAIGNEWGRRRDSIARLQKVRGMVDVSPDYKVDIRPPDAPILW